MDLLDPMTHLMKVLKPVFQGGKWLVKAGTMWTTELLYTGGKLTLVVLDATGQAASRLFTLPFRIDGAVYSLLVPVDIPGAVVRFVEVIKDGSGQLLRDAQGRMVARLEVNGQQVLGVVEEAASVVARLRARLVSSGWQAADIDLFLADFADNADALAKFDNGALDPQAWRALSVHTVLRKDPTILQKATSVLKKGHVNQADFETIISVNKGLGARASAVADLLDDLDNFALYRNQSGFGAIISGLKADWYNGAGADGANWVIAALRKEGAATFPATTTNFEVSKTIGSNTRRYDAIVDNAITVGGAPRNRYFEFKSYGSVPPSNFAEQFINDLNNGDIIDLSQLKWYFDAAKNPPNFEINMKAAIDGLTLNGTLASKFIKDIPNPTGNDLKQFLKDYFSTIFQLK
jgi:hypothetical protein